MLPGKLLSDWAVHPDVEFIGELHRVGMVGFHCDGVTYTSSGGAGKQKSVLVASLNIISAPSVAKRQRRFPLFCIRKARLCKCGCSGYCTMQTIFSVVAWSFRVLLSAITPSVRHNDAPFTEYDLVARSKPGEQIPVAALLQVRGDWEGLWSFFRLRTATQQNFCWQCDTTIAPGPMCYDNFARDAPHRTTQFTHKTYMQRCAADGVQPSTLFNCPGTELQHLIVDSMHAADLGSFCDAVGSIFYLEITNPGWHNNQAEGLKDLNAKLNRFYSLNKGLTKATPVSLPQIISRDIGYPFFKSKAAPVRHLAEFCLPTSTDWERRTDRRSASPRTHSCTAARASTSTSS